MVMVKLYKNYHNNKSIGTLVKVQSQLNLSHDNEWNKVEPYIIIINICRFIQVN